MSTNVNFLPFMLTICLHNSAQKVFCLPDLPQICYFRGGEKMRVVGIWKSKKGKALFVVVTRRGHIIAGPFGSAKAAFRWISDRQAPGDPGGR